MIAAVTTQPPPAEPFAAPTWRREPYRVLFPLGVALSWAGVGHWLLLAVFGAGTYSGVFHSIAQVQGFLMAIAAGFLFTAVPRRTGTAPPAAWEMVVACAAPGATCVAAWFGALALAQAFWGALVLVLLAFVLRRLVSASAGRRAPNCFVWLPLAFAMAGGGAALIGAQRPLGNEWFWLHDIGQNLILQGMFLSLIVGLGGMVIPLLTRGESVADGGDSARDRFERLAHVLAATALVASFVIEARVSRTGGYGLRAAVVLALLLGVAKVWRPPSLPGWHRWLLWFSAWCLPLGYLAATLAPYHDQAGLHVVFIGGFGLMALCVSLHVALAHGGYQALVRRGSWQVAALGALIAIALLARVGMTWLPNHVWLLMGVASAAFLLATGAWLHLVLPRLWTPAPTEEALP